MNIVIDFKCSLKRRVLSVVFLAYNDLISCFIRKFLAFFFVFLAAFEDELMCMMAYFVPN